MTTQLDLGLSRDARDRALKRVKASSDPEWFAIAVKTILAVAATHEDFTTDEIWKAGLSKPREPRALGSAMVMLAREGLIRRTGLWRPTKQVLRHHAPVAVWKRT